jgi:hypothetical protein
MTTVEVRPSEGGADAEEFADEMVHAISRALTREDIEHALTKDYFINGISISNDHWL